ncbi:MAG: ATP-binding cassette domain-containing protein, partial [Acutalibacteraceae bacterium]
PYSTLSFGERTKVLLAILFIRENSFLLIDEPTNHLDTAARGTLARYLKTKRGFILVSHDRAFLDAVVDHVISINRADITVMRGNFTTWQQEKDREDQFELQQSEKLKKDVKRLEAAAKRSAEWSDRKEKTKNGAYDSGFVGHKAAKMMKRSKSIEARRSEALSEKSALLKNIESADTKLAVATLRHPKALLAEARDLSVDYGTGPVFPPLRFEIRRGERVALQGRNGCGKSSILKLLCGEDIPHTGTLETASGLIVSYIPQSAEGLSGTLSDFCTAGGVDESLFKAILRKLEFQRAQFEKRMEEFSEGQKKKVLIAKSLCEKAHLLVWDEPLNFIDVISRMQLEALLISAAPTVVFVEHDRRFVENTATKIIEI